jgi:hypothetical protein
MIEFENIHEVAESLNEPANWVLVGDEAPTAREVLEACLVEADQYENVIVIRFAVTKKPDGGCQTEGDTRLSVRSTHAAIHGLQVIEETVESLKENLAKQIIKSILGRKERK